MSRSNVVYLVMWPEEGKPPRSGFTVKHELEHWLSRHRDTEWKVWRIADGSHYPDAKAIPLDRQTLLPFGQVPPA